MIFSFLFLLKKEKFSFCLLTIRKKKGIINVYKLSSEKMGYEENTVDRNGRNNRV